jgi:hypothetical protein
MHGKMKVPYGDTCLGQQKRLLHMRKIQTMGVACLCVIWSYCTDKFSDQRIGTTEKSTALKLRLKLTRHVENDRQCTYSVTFRRIRETTAAVEKQQALLILSVCF